MSLMGPSRGYHAALIILAAPHFAGRPEVEDHVHDGWIDVQALLEGWPWSPGELTALRAACALYNGTRGADVADLARLDDELASLVLFATRHALGLTDRQVA